jgi:hypothetical protein
MRNFNKVEFSEAISGKFTRLRSSGIHNPTLSFLHRWMSFTLFPWWNYVLLLLLSLNVYLLW